MYVKPIKYNVMLADKNSNMWEGGRGRGSGTERKRWWTNSWAEAQERVNSLVVMNSNPAISAFSIIFRKTILTNKIQKTFFKSFLKPVIERFLIKFTFQRGLDYSLWSLVAYCFESKVKRVRAVATAAGCLLLCFRQPRPNRTCHLPTGSSLNVAMEYNSG